MRNIRSEHSAWPKEIGNLLRESTKWNSKGAADQVFQKADIWQTRAYLLTCYDPQNELGLKHDESEHSLGAMRFCQVRFNSVLFLLSLVDHHGWSNRGVCLKLKI